MKIKSKSINIKVLILMLISGSLGAIVFVVLPQYQHKLEQARIPVTTPTPDNPFPELIAIERLGLNMSVKEATVSANSWQVFDNAVSYLKGSGNLKGGNLILYGHNAKTAFGKIIRLGKNDVITLSNSQYTRRYQVVRVFQTNRSDLSEINKSQDQLTMYTCSGWFDAKRYFVIAKPVE